MKTDKNWNTEEVPNNIWNNIERELDKKNKKAIIWWRLAGIIVLSLTSYTVAKFLVREEINEENKLVIVQPIKKNEPIVLNEDLLIDSVKDNYQIKKEVPKLQQEVLKINDTITLNSYDIIELKDISANFVVNTNEVKMETYSFSTSQSLNYGIEYDGTSQGFANGTLTKSPGVSVNKIKTDNWLSRTFRRKEKSSSTGWLYNEPAEGGYKRIKEPSTGYFGLSADSIVFHSNEELNESAFTEYKENEFKSPEQEPLSTLSIDVDKASLPTFRSYVENGTKAPKNAVRIEEFINYFQYNYPNPTGNNPVSINTEYSKSPWNKKGMLLKVGLKGKEVTRDDTKHSNLVFLIDVSGSMSDQDKLPLLKESLYLLVDQLGEEDYISVVTYAGSAGLVLPSTSGLYKEKIKKALRNLESGGSTAGADGIELAYQQAKLNYREGHSNRVILATDGDFNVGVSSDEGLEELIVQKRETGIELSVLGFGDGNFQSSKMENLAQNGNGNFSYLDNLKEANKVLVNEMRGTLQTIAKDVKLQVEFNPLTVGAYRLIGYENRILAHEDFNNDKVDASDMGAGHTITVVYEIIPVNMMDSSILNNLKYQKVKQNEFTGTTNELATVSMRYKEPGGSVSKKVEHTAYNKETIASVDFEFIKGVIGFCQLYKKSKYRGSYSLQEIVNTLSDGKGKDSNGYRKEFIEMIKKCDFE